MARYIVNNPTSYVFSALTASVDAPVHFEPVADAGPSARVGTLTVPMSAQFLINDGQHRRAAIQQALLERPELGDETIAVVVFLDFGQQRCQQMFADLNMHAVRPGKSLGVLYDHRNPMSAVTRLSISRLQALKQMTDMEHNNLSGRSRKLFTLSGIHTANCALLDGISDEQEVLVDLVVKYWEVLLPLFPDWLQVSSGAVRAGDLRRDFIHSHGIVIQALGKIGNSLLTESRDPKRWQRSLRNLTVIDWHRDNTSVWEGRAMLGGKVSRTTVNVLLTTATIRELLGLPLPEDEARTLELCKESA
jgi:DNA sulfur modification protein DndB